jgi:sporulation protein YlmC with PRC-barrel domain
VIVLNPSKLHGRKVVDSEGYILGEADGVDIDLSTWQATGLLVDLNDEATAEFGFRSPS